MLGFSKSTVNFNEAMTHLIAQIIQNLEEFKHVDLSKVAVSATYSKSRSRSGLLAYLLPLRYKDGSTFIQKTRYGKIYHYGVDAYHHNGRELLYIIYFMLPRFLRLSYKEKLNTVIHELYHISPDFNGDLRRLKGRSHLHGNSLKEYDAVIKVLTEKFLKLNLEEEAAFLKGRYTKFESHHIPEPRPKLIHVENVL